MSKKTKKKRVTRVVKGREEKKNKILRAAEKVFAKKGFDGARMDDIAKTCRMPKPNLYYYYKSKKEIYQIIIMEILDEWGKAFEELSIDRDPKESLEAYIKAKLKYSREHSFASKIVGGETIRDTNLLIKSQNETLRRITREKCEVIQAWVDAGKIDPVEPQHFLIMIWASTQFYADFDDHVKTNLGVKRLTDDDYDNAEKVLIHVILKGCGLSS